MSQAALVSHDHAVLIWYVVNGRATGQKGVGEGGAAVVLERAKFGVKVHHVACGRSEAATIACTNQGVAQGSGGAEAVRAADRRVSRDDVVDQVGRATVVDAGTVVGLGRVHSK